MRSNQLSSEYNEATPGIGIGILRGAGLVTIFGGGECEGRRRGEITLAASVGQIVSSEAERTIVV